MKTSLIIFGVIFLAVGIFFYFVPVLNLSADTSTASGGETDVRTSSATITIPVGWAYTLAIIGFVLLMIGLFAPGRSRVIQGPKGARGPRGYVNHKKKKTYVHHRRPVKRRPRRRYLPKGTSITTTTRTRRSR